MAIALDRLKAVTSNTLSLTDNRRNVLKIFLINIISVLAILPYSLHMKVNISISFGIFSSFVDRVCSISSRETLKDNIFSLQLY